MSANEGTGGPWTVARLLAWTRRYLEERRVESPRLCAEILLAHAMQCRRLSLFTQHESEPGAEIRDAFRALVRQAGEGAPIAYLVGAKEFFALSFEVTPEVLIPRPETEVLVERAIHHVRARADATCRILDVGTGSGCIAVALARNLPAARIFASDISEAALSVARRNAAKHAVAERIEFRAGDLLTPWDGEEPFDVIVSNPPYVSRRDADALPRNVRDYEPAIALFGGDDGLETLGRLAADAGALLLPEGHLLVEIAWDQGPRVRTLLESVGWADVVMYRDGLQHERVAHARRRAMAAAVA